MKTVLSKASIPIGKRQREKTISEYMTDNPNGTKCSRCGLDVEHADKRCTASVCWRCSLLGACLMKKKYWKIQKKKCKKCGKQIVNGYVCKSCQNKQRKHANRKRKQQRKTRID